MPSRPSGHRASEELGCSAAIVDPYKEEQDSIDFVCGVEFCFFAVVVIAKEMGDDVSSARDDVASQ